MAGGIIITARLGEMIYMASKHALFLVGPGSSGWAFKYSKFAAKCRSINSSTKIVGLWHGFKKMLADKKRIELCSALPKEVHA